MKGCLLIDAPAQGRQSSDTTEIDLIGAVPKEGYVEYGFGGMIGYHHNVVEYFRDAADNGKIILAFSVSRPQEATALYRLFTLAGRKVRRAAAVAKRDDGTRYAELDIKEATIHSVYPVEVSSGTIYLVVIQIASGNAKVKF